MLGIKTPPTKNLKKISKKTLKKFKKKKKKKFKTFKKIQKIIFLFFVCNLSFQAGFGRSPVRQISFLYQAEWPWRGVEAF